MDSEPQVNPTVVPYAPRPVAVGGLTDGIHDRVVCPGALICVAFGVAAFVVPFYVAGHAWALNTDGVFRFLNSAINRGKGDSIAYFAGLAFFIGLIRRFPLGMVGPLMMLPFVAALVDDVSRGRGPNLLPVVVLVYIGLAFGGSVCAVLGRLTRMAVGRVRASLIRRSREA